jgi:hypothetical protein
LFATGEQQTASRKADAQGLEQVTASKHILVFDLIDHVLILRQSG